MSQSPQLAQECHRNLPTHIRRYLREARGISGNMIDRHLLGWNGSRITIPVFGRERNFALFKLAKDPEDKTGSPKMLTTPGAPAELYVWEQILAKPTQIILCDGALDPPVRDSQGFAAVTSTAPAFTSPPDYAL